MLFNIRKSFICSFCRGKRYDGIRLDGGCGICTECAQALPVTPKKGSFAGGRGISYVISPLFYEGAVRDAIVKYKFGGWSANGEVFSYIMRKHIEDFPHLSEFDTVVPVPLSKERLYERGFNQVHVIAETVAAAAQIECRTDLLIKNVNNSKQSGVSGVERIMNVKGVFSASGDVRGKKMIICDDVYTTGATLEECAAVLRNAGAVETIGVTLAIKSKKEKNNFLRY